MKRQHFLLLLALVGAVGAYLFWQSPGSRTVTVVNPRQGLAVELVYATGVIEPVNQTVIATQSAGELTELLIDEGAVVAVGQVLARLDSVSMQQKVDELAAKVELEQKSLERAQSLRQRGAGSQETLDEAGSRLAQARAQLEAAKDQLARRNLVSPTGGVVLRRDGEPGEYLPAGEQVFVVGDTATLRAELEVDEEDIPRVQLAQKVLLTADAFPGQVFEASVSEITPLGDNLNKSYRVRVNLPEAVKLPVGMTVEANIVVQEKQGALLIPSSAVSAGSIFIVEGRHAAARKVTLGITGFEESEVVQGIGASAAVIAQPPGDLRDGERVRVVH